MINGMVFNDSDADGNKAANEQTLAGLTVYLDANRNGVLDPGETSVTDSKGNYNLTVPAGSYEVREIPQTGFRITTPASTDYDLTAGVGETTIKFFGNTTPC